MISFFQRKIYHLWCLDEAVFRNEQEFSKQFVSAHSKTKEEETRKWILPRNQKKTVLVVKDEKETRISLKSMKNKWAKWQFFDEFMFPEMTDLNLGDSITIYEP